MYYKFKCGKELIDVYVWENNLHHTVTVEDDKSYERTIREDKNGKFFTWNHNKIYLSDWIRVTMEELNEKTKN